MCTHTNAATFLQVQLSCSPSLPLLPFLFNFPLFAFLLQLVFSPSLDTPIFCFFPASISVTYLLLLYLIFLFALFCPASCRAALNTSLFYFSSPPKVGQQSDLLFAFTSISLPSSACIPISPSVPPFLALSLFACLPFTNHCSRQTSSHQSNPTTKGTLVTAGHFDWHWPETHTHTQSSAQDKNQISLTLSIPCFLFT